jgi:hypothetical protein
MRPFSVGAIGFLLVAVWWTKHPKAGASSRWVLEPIDGIGSCAVFMLFATALAVAIRPREMTWLRGSALAAGGVATGVVAGLFAVGPGNLWPLVLVIDAAILAVPVIVGSVLGQLLFSFRPVRS